MEFNPSSWPHRLTIALLSLVGVCIAGYLTAVQLHAVPAAWDPVFDGGSEQVLFSSFSQSLPVPDASVGGIAYLLEFLVAWVGPADRWKTSPDLVFFSGIIIIGMVIGSTALVCIQAFVVHAWCFLCLLSAALSWIIGAVAAPELAKAWQRRTS